MKIEHFVNWVSGKCEQTEQQMCECATGWEKSSPAVEEELEMKNSGT